MKQSADSNFKHHRFSRWRTTKEIQSRLQIEYKINIPAVQDDVKALSMIFQIGLLKMIELSLSVQTKSIR